MYSLRLLTMVAALGCAGTVEEPEEPEEPKELVLNAPPECAPLAGQYRVVYAKRRGDCADLPEQIASFSDRAHTSALNGSCEAEVSSSEDDCQREEDAVCPIVGTDGTLLGSASLITAFSQTSAVRVEGMATIEINPLVGAGCTATYALIGSKVE